MKRISLILATLLLAATTLSSYAQTNVNVEKAVNNIVKKHENSTGVNCMTVVKGNGLEMIKMMLNKEFGKDFMKGVTSITIIDYSDASEDVCAVLRKDLDAFLSILKEFDVSKEKQFSDNDYIRCFASVSESGTVSDFVIALEDEEKSKMIMYMAGAIKVEL